MITDDLEFLFVCDKENSFYLIDTCISEIIANASHEGTDHLKSGKDQRNGFYYDHDGNDIWKNEVLNSQKRLQELDSFLEHGMSF